MKKLLFTATLLLFFSQFASSQNVDEKILNVRYKLLPISKYYFKHEETTSIEQREFSIALRSGYKFTFDLSVNLKTNKSLFLLDTLIVTKVKGKEDYWTKPENRPKYCIKESNNSYCRREDLFEQQAHIRGKQTDIEWQITKETKKILNFECIKATSKNKSFLITVWFTKEIPVSSGPSNFFGLPGLVLWAEDYFSTISVEKIAYSTNDGTFDKQFSKQLEIFKAGEEGNQVTEKVFLLKKAALSEEFMGSK